MRPIKDEGDEAGLANASTRAGELGGGAREAGAGVGVAAGEGVELLGDLLDLPLGAVELGEDLGDDGDVQGVPEDVGALPCLGPGEADEAGDLVGDAVAEVAVLGVEALVELQEGAASTSVAKSSLVTSGPRSLPPTPRSSTPSTATPRRVRSSARTANGRCQRR